MSDKFNHLVEQDKKEYFEEIISFESLEEVFVTTELYVSRRINRK